MRKWARADEGRAHGRLEVLLPSPVACSRRSFHQAAAAAPAVHLSRSVGGAIGPRVFSISSCSSSVRAPPPESPFISSEVDQGLDRAFARTRPGLA